jgi:predicted molibdopterin-dependent oxidoreductase YjgC
LNLLLQKTKKEGMEVGLVKLTIDGNEVQVPKGTMVLEAAEQIGIHIPRLCYDPDLSNVGACRLCIVEIEGMRNLPASCVTEVREGMVVRTDTPAVMEARVKGKTIASSRASSMRAWERRGIFDNR